MPLNLCRREVSTSRYSWLLSPVLILFPVIVLSTGIEEAEADFLLRALLPADLGRVMRSRTLWKLIGHRNRDDLPHGFLHMYIA